ncbi:hypothetical protein SPRG_19687 [Saprolegnia parasitica CBS 223.65]|uniref:Uncharacterized protein n=1 Tax=Saprolegnia parasitica (strain CBS 223.65) TaxID=695850 RepID=A0A067CGX9_SAPPC|nr:hypothetical protein SPRG_19687 [Saprolegnia parasitica CBS 223.65]KDO29728.1 hypothetical protein SPRG_19687 [Saprolegnia parasitica CBS 223.65]|eukprot:XP_012199514.1 hypothetical protein SPRG_19687 [Saprolegnia parasitica CBS 223.65]
MRSAQNSVVSEYKVAATPKWNDENADDAVANEAKHAAEFEVITSGLEHPQVTIKSLVVGTIMGTFTSVLAMYYSLKLGVTPSLNVLSGIGGFMLCRALMKTQFFGKHFTVQENVVIQTCAVACMSLASQAGFGSGILGLTENVFLIMGNTTYAGNLASDVIDFTWLRSFGWCASIALFGFFISFPLRRKFIIEMRLLFPSGTATAVMIKTLHTSKEAVEYQWNVLLKSGVFAYVWSIFVFCFNGLGEFPIFGEKAAGFTWILDFAPGTFAISLMLPFRVMYSMFLGNIITWGILMPVLKAQKLGVWFESEGAAGLKAYYTFTAVAIICVDALYSIVKMGIIIGKSWSAKNDEPKTLSEVDDKESENDVLSKAQRQAYLDKIFESAHIPTWSWVGGLIVFATVSVVVISLMFETVKWYKSKNKVLNVIANHCPLPMAVSIGMIVPASFGLEGMIMAGIIAYWKSKDEDSFEKTQYILAAGLMTGEGFSVLTQIIVTLCGGSAPVQVSYAMTP